VSAARPRAEACLVCGRPAGKPFVELQDVPVHPNVLWSTPEEARGARRGDISLALCEGCGLIWNTRFDPDVLSYDADYENSLHFSGEFRRYTQELAERLIESHELEGKHVAEIGSGKGEFLSLLCEKAGCTGIGFDPSYAGESDGRAEGRVTFVRDLFGPDSDLGEADLVVSRHVVEHLDDPVGVLDTLRRALGKRRASVYVEVPSAEYLLREDAIWDIIYPHVTCLTASALRNVLARAGFHPREHGYSFGGQYLWVEASTDPPESQAAAGTNGGASQAVTEFATRMAEKRKLWADRLPRLLADRPVAVWGAGAKGTTFLNVVAGGASIETVVDVNPRKRGKYIPGTGQRIVAAESLVEQGAGTVVVMNPVYSNEIGLMLGRLGLDAEVLVA
jgi:SAM-dependent methyltransferase